MAARTAILAGFSADRMAGGAAPFDPVEGDVLDEIVTGRMEKPLLAGNPGRRSRSR